MRKASTDAIRNSLLGSTAQERDDSTDGFTHDSEEDLFQPLSDDEQISSIDSTEETERPTSANGGTFNFGKQRVQGWNSDDEEQLNRSNQSPTDPPVLVKRGSKIVTRPRRTVTGVDDDDTYSNNNSIVSNNNNNDNSSVLSNREDSMESRMRSFMQKQQLNLNKLAEQRQFEQSKELTFHPKITSYKFRYSPQDYQNKKLAREIWRVRSEAQALEEFAEVHTFQPNISTYAASLKFQDPVHLRLFRHAQILQQMQQQLQQEEEELAKKTATLSTSGALASGTTDPEERMRKITLLYEDAIARKIRKEKRLADVLNKEKRIREKLKVSKHSATVLIQKFKQSLITELTGLQPDDNNISKNNSNNNNSTNNNNSNNNSESKNAKVHHNLAVVDNEELLNALQNVGFIKRLDNANENEEDLKKDEKFVHLFLSFLDPKQTNQSHYKDMTSLLKLVAWWGSGGEKGDMYEVYTQLLAGFPKLEKLLSQFMKHLHSFTLYQHNRKPRTPPPPPEPTPTFKPTLYKAPHMSSAESSTLPRHELLYMQAQEQKKQLEQKAKKREKDRLNGCTFSPKIKRTPAQEDMEIERHELLYASHKNKKMQAQPTIEKELKKCTFKPQIHKSPGPKKEGSPQTSPAAVAGYSETVARMRQAQLERRLVQQLTSFRSPGLAVHHTNKYTPSTSTSTYSSSLSPSNSPSSSSSSPAKQDSSPKFSSKKITQPIMYLDVALTPDRSERIAVYKNSNPHYLAKEFAISHGLEHTLTEALENLIAQQLTQYNLQQSRLQQQHS